MLHVASNVSQGQCYPRDTLTAMMRFCQKHRIHLISDEIYALSVFDTGNADAIPFTSVLSIDTTDVIDNNYLHVLYGMSKVSRTVLLIYLSYHS